MKKFLFITLMFVLLNSAVYADGTITNKIENGTDGSALDQAGFVIPYKTGTFNDEGSSKNTILYCMSGMNVTSPDPTTTCKTNQNLYSLEKRIRIAAIIDYGMTTNQATGDACAKATSGVLSNVPVDFTCYTQTEIAIHTYLNAPLTNPIGRELNDAYKSYGKKVYEKAPYEKALAIAKSTFEPKFYLKSNNNEVKTLEFKLDDSGNYITENLYVTGDYITSDAYTVSVSGNSSAKVVGNSKSFYITIPQTAVNSVIDLKVSVNNIKQQSYRESYIFDCSGGVQDLGTVGTKQRTKSISVSGKVGTTQLIIKKVDANGKLIAGAKIKVENEDKSYSKTFETTTNELVLTGLQYGKYIITEISAPDKYSLVKEPITATLSEKELTKTVSLKNKLNKVKISKTDMANSKLLPGATLEIQDEKGNIVKYCKDEKGNSIECKWVSDDEAYEIEGMPNGKYYLVETVAPEGYVLSKEKVEFIVDGKKEVIEVKMENELEVKVPDTLSSRSALLLAIAMFDIALGIGVITYVKKHKVQE